MSEKDHVESVSSDVCLEFKRPQVVRKPPKKAISALEKPEITTDIKSENPEESISSDIPYKIPSWSGLCPEGTNYALEVLKSGLILDKIELTSKPYYVFGRLSNCEIILAHPTISRYHAVLQYKAFDDDEQPTGWYIYDLGSTHGTFLNRQQVKEKHYTRVRVGHQIKFGLSSRIYIVLEPEEEPDLADNPYASTANEELYLQDPKKTLRGFYAREGIELLYDCIEKGVGQFSCSVELPIDDAKGRPVIAEVIHRGKKKDAVVACALEACRILDRVGLLRQAKHESRRRKERDWSADDYYDSDEDTFFDRTGNVEKKRHARMEKLGVVTSQSNKPPDYYDLVTKIKELESNITKEEESMESMREEMRQNAKYSERLDDYMKTIDSIPNYYQTTEHKEMISKSKLKVKQMQAELVEYRRLAEIAKPVDLSQLTTTKSSIPVKKTNSVVYGKRIRLKDDMIKKPPINKSVNQETKQEEFVEEVESDEEPGLSSNEGIRPTASAGTSKEDTNSSIVTQSFSEKFQHSTNMEVSNIEQRLSPGKDIRSGAEHEDENNITKSPKTIINKEKKVYGPMRPPANYVIPDNYYDQASDRDLPEITENLDT